jgi:PAS domain S-box-containing protein
VVAEQAHPAWGGEGGYTPPPSGEPAGRGSRERLDAVSRAVIESAADAIVAYGTDRTVMLWNPAAERMFGWAADEVIGLEPPTIPEESAAEHNAVFERVRGGGQVSFATRRIRKDGSVIDVRIDTSALTDGTGEVIGWVNICHQTGEDDVARHYMAERARVVRRLGDVVADMNAQRDLESVLDRIAASLRELTGADAGGFVLIEDERLRLVSTAGLPARLRGRVASLSSSLVGELLRSGKTVMMATDEAGGFDDLIWSALPGLHTIALSLSHVGGRPYGALYALYSRRSLSHVELELLELLAGHAGVALTNAMAFEEVVRQRAHERAVIDGSADGIAVLDESGNVKQWNPAAHRITGTPAGEVMGTPPPFPLPVPGERRTHKLPSGRWVDVLCTELGDGGEKVVDFRDVTAAKELEEAKDLFLATTSHELRTPITVVQGFASTLASRWEQLSDADRRAAVRTIAERAGSLGRLVEQLLLGARAGADALPVNNDSFDLAALLRATVVSFGPLSDKHVVVADVPADLPLAYGDGMATDIIVGQLLENAFKYSPSGGTVLVRARVVGPMIEVDVEDDGIGIAPGDHERIFERFVQGETGDRRRFGGVGIGLFIVRRLAVAQNGTVIAKTRPEGGTIMRLTLRRAGELQPGLLAVARLAAGGGQVLVDDAGDVIAVAQDLAGLHPDHPVAALLDLAQVVGDQEDRAGLVPQLLDPVVALGPERGVAGGQRLVNHQDLVALGGRDREPEPLGHTGRVGAHRQVDEAADPREVDDLLVVGLDLGRRHAHGEAAEHHVPLAGEVVEQGGVDAQQRRLARGVDGALLGREQPGDGAEQGRLAGAVPADDPDHVAVAGDEGDAADRVDLPDGDPALPLDQAHQRRGGGALVAACAVNAVDHVQVIDHDGRVSHGAHPLGSSAEQGSVTTRRYRLGGRRESGWQDNLDTASDNTLDTVSDNTSEICRSRFHGRRAGAFPLMPGS